MNKKAKKKKITAFQAGEEMAKLHTTLEYKYVRSSSHAAAVLLHGPPPPVNMLSFLGNGLYCGCRV